MKYYFYTIRFQYKKEGDYYCESNITDKHPFLHYFLYKETRENCSLIFFQEISLKEYSLFINLATLFHDKKDILENIKGYDFEEI